MKISKIKSVGNKQVYDISVDQAEHYVLENGVITHNTGQVYSANTIFIIGRQQEKTGKDVIGYNFIINVEKSRFVKEKSKIPIMVTFDGGINRWSGLLDVALELGHVTKPSNGYYTRPHIENDKKIRQKDTNTADFWMPVFNDTSFLTYITKRYKLGTIKSIEDEG